MGLKQGLNHAFETFFNFFHFFCLSPLTLFSIILYLDPSTREDNKTRM